MKVLMLINSFNLGGAEKLSYDLAYQLTQKGIKVYVASLGTCQTIIENNNKKKLNNEGISTLVIGKRRKKDRISSIVKLFSILKENEIDIIHTNGPSPDLYGRIAGIFAKTNRIIVTMHDNKSYNKKIEGLFQHWTSSYIAISDVVYAYCINQLRINNQKVHLVHNSILMASFNKTSNLNLRKELMIADTDIIIVTVARLAPPKNYEFMFNEIEKVFEARDDVQWIIVGEYDEHRDYYLKCKSLVKTDYQDRIHMLGVRNDIPDVLKNCDIYFQASHFEGFGISLIEAMAAELPVVTTNVGVIPEIIDSGGRVFLLESDTLKHYIDKIQDNVKEYIVKNKQLICERYSIEHASQVIEEIYYGKV